MAELKPLSQVALGSDKVPCTRSVQTCLVMEICLSQASLASPASYVWISFQEPFA